MKAMKIEISPRAVSLWRLESTLLLAAAGLLLGGVAVFSRALSALLQGAALAAYGYLMLYHCEKRRQNLRLWVENGTLTVTCGVWIRRRSALPLEGVQILRVGRTVTQRLFGLCSVTLFLPGAKLTVAGLNIPSCRRLVRCVRSQGGQAG